MSAEPTWTNPTSPAFAEPPLSPPVTPESAAPSAEPAPEPLLAVVAPTTVYEPPAPALEVPAPVAPAPEPALAFPASADPLPAPPPPSEPPSVAPRPVTLHRVYVRLAGGERVEVAAHPDEQAARDEATALMRYLREARGDWPYVAGRFIRPDAIVSVDVGAG